MIPFQILAAHILYITRGTMTKKFFSYLNYLLYFYFICECHESRERMDKKNISSYESFSESTAWLFQNERQFVLICALIYFNVIAISVANRITSASMYLSRTHTTCELNHARLRNFDSVKRVLKIYGSRMHALRGNPLNKLIN